MAKERSTLKEQEAKSLELYFVLMSDVTGEYQEKVFDIQLFKDMVRDCPDTKAAASFRELISHYQDGDEVLRCGAIQFLSGVVYLVIRRGGKEIYSSVLAKA